MGYLFFQDSGAFLYVLMPVLIPPSTELPACRMNGVMLGFDW